MPRRPLAVLLTYLFVLTVGVAGPILAGDSHPTTAAAQDKARQTLRVGPGRTLTQPSQAARIAEDGALVEIEAGDYHGDVTVWRQHGLSLRGVNGRARLHADAQAAEAKAIWVIKGNLAEVENIEFSGTQVPDLNGAGIRAEGRGLTIRNCRFHHNQMGILTNNDRDSFLVIEGSEFDHNTTGPNRQGRIGHNIYVGRIGRFTLTDSDVHDALIGHEVKTRAWRNTIVGNRILDGEGASSYLIDLAEGGEAQITHNTMEKSAKAPNRTAIAFASEANRAAAGQSLLVKDNTYRVVGNPGIFVRNRSGAAAQVIGNRIHGGAEPLEGRGKVR